MRALNLAHWNDNFAFRFGHPFELPLLAQSGIMIVSMLVMLELCTRIKRESELTAKRRKFTGKNCLYLFMK